MWRGWIWRLVGNDTGGFCFLWCLVLTDFCCTLPRLPAAVRVAGCGRKGKQWSAALAVKWFSGEELEGCRGSLPLDLCSASCWHHFWGINSPKETLRLCHCPHTAVPSSGGNCKFNFTDRLYPQDEIMQRHLQEPNLLARPQWSWGYVLCLCWC